MQRPIQIAIVGGSGSGKTWLAARLLEAFPGSAVAIVLDDFYRDLAHLPLGRRHRVNFDHPRAIDWDSVRAAAETLSRGQPACIPSYDFATHTRRRGGRLVEPKPVVIWDGLWLLRPRWLRPYFALGVYVDCPPAVRLRRRIKRDMEERRRSEASVRWQFVRHVLPMHARFVEPQRRWAGCIVCSPIHTTALSRLVADFRSVLQPKRHL